MAVSASTEECLATQTVFVMKIDFNPFAEPFDKPMAGLSKPAVSLFEGLFMVRQAHHERYLAYLFSFFVVLTARVARGFSLATLLINALQYTLSCRLKLIVSQFEKFLKNLAETM